MFCPECGAEYRVGFLECADCGVALTAQPPAETLEIDEPMVGAFRSADAAILPVVKSLLTAEGIPFAVQGDEASGLFPLGAVNPRLGAVVRVPQSRAEEAEQLLESVTWEDARLEEE